MFADPQTVTINSVAKTLARYMLDGTKSLYQTSDEVWKFTISHTKTKDRVRSMVRLDQLAVVEDPLSGENDYDTLSFYFVIDRPVFGFTAAQVEQIVAGLKTWLDNTAIGKLLGSES